MKNRFRQMTLAGVLTLALGVSLTPTAVSADERIQSLGEAIAGHSRSARVAWDPSTGISKKAWSSTLVDDAVKIGESGRAFVVEPRPTSAEVFARSDRAAPFSTEVSLASAFSLHSRPGSLKTIFLDMNGHNVSGTQWDDNDIFGNSSSSRRIPGYNIQGKSTTYSSLERQKIIDLWSSVSEDYAMFDVDVTTETPSQSALDRSSAGDTRFGVRVVVSDESNKIANWCGCGGVAYVGVFNHYAGKDGDGTSHYGYSPAFAFTRPAFGGKTISDIVSHEVGHTLGLSHDGASEEYYEGHEGWAPIMGAGYEQSLVQWSNGTYTSATNQEDDLALMQAFGASLLLDDYGDTSNSAQPVELNVVETGLISTRTDVDVFSFVPLTSTVDVSVALPSRSPNLDVNLVVTDSLGNTIATDNPGFQALSATVSSGLSASVTLSALTPGDTYFAKIDGVGWPGAVEGYSDYGSVGEYQLVVLGEEISPTSTPVISGSTKVGRTLTVNVGTWMPGTTLTKTWRRNGSTISGATGDTYKLKSADVNKRITVRVTATRLGYSPATMTSAPTAKVRR